MKQSARNLMVVLNNEKEKIDFEKSLNPEQYQAVKSNGPVFSAGRGRYR